MAVCMAPAAFDDEDEPVAAEAAADAAELALPPMLLAFESAELATLDALARAELAVDSAPETREEAVSIPPLPKMVVEPIVVVKVEEPEVSTETMAEVVMAEEPAPPATPPIPKIVVDPIVLVKVEAPEVTTISRADVVIALEVSPAPEA